MRKTAKYNDGHRSPTGAKIEESFNEKICLKNILQFHIDKKNSSPKMSSKILCELLIGSYGQFKVFHKT